MAGRIKGITIELNGETTKLQNALKNVDKGLRDTNNSLKDVDKLLKLDPKNVELLNQKEKLLNSAIEDTKTRLESLQNVAENSDLGEAEHDAVQREIIETQQKLDGLEGQLDSVTAASDEQVSAFDELSNTISDQEKELDSLKNEYISAVLEFGKGSEEANNLATEISSLSSELIDNRSKLEEASSAADSLDASLADTSGSIGDVGDASTSMSSIFGGSIGSMVDAFVAGGLIGMGAELVGSLGEVAEAVFDLANEWTEDMADIAIGTGATGEALEDLTTQAREASNAIAGVTNNDMANILAEVNTRLGYTGDQAQYATEEIAMFAKATGQDGVSAIDDLTDIMKQYHMDAEDIPGIMNDITTASQGCSMSAGEMQSALLANAGTFQEMGWSIEESLGFMEAYDNAGGNVSNITGGMRTAINKLTGEVDDVPGAIMTAIGMMQQWDGESDILSATVGETGKTISETFGGKNALTLANTMREVGGSVNTCTSALKNNDDAYKSTYKSSVTMKEEMGQMNKQVGNTAATFLNAYLNNLQLAGALQEGGESAREAQQKFAETDSAIDLIGKTFTDTSADMERSSAEAFSSIPSDASSAMSDAYNSVDGGMSSIESRLSGRLSFPYVETPHFSMSGQFDLEKGTVPTVSVRYWAKAMDHAYVLSNPTIFGAMGGHLLGGGEAGREVVSGESHLMKMIESAVGGAGNTYIVNGLTYDDGSNVADAVSALIRAAKIERRA